MSPSQVALPRFQPLRTVCPSGRYRIDLAGGSWLLRELPTGHPLQTGLFPGKILPTDILALSDDGRVLTVVGDEGTSQSYVLFPGPRIGWESSREGMESDAASAAEKGWPVGMRQLARRFRTVVYIALVTTSTFGWLPLSLAVALAALLAGASSRRVRVHLSLSDGRQPCLTTRAQR